MQGEHQWDWVKWVIHSRPQRPSTLQDERQSSNLPRARVVGSIHRCKEILLWREKIVASATGGMPHLAGVCGNLTDLNLFFRPHGLPRPRETASASHS